MLKYRVSIHYPVPGQPDRLHQEITDAATYMGALWQVWRKFSGASMVSISPA